MKRFLPWLLIAVGIGLGVVGFVLRQGTPDAHVAVTNLTSSFMFISAFACVVIGIACFFIRDDSQW